MINVNSKTAEELYLENFKIYEDETSYGKFFLVNERDGEIYELTYDMHSEGIRYDLKFYQRKDIESKIQLNEIYSKIRRISCPSEPNKIKKITIEDLKKWYIMELCQTIFKFQQKNIKGSWDVS